MSELTIDIISYTSEQFAALSNDQVYEVQKAQRSKNALTQKLEKSKRAEKYRLVKNGTFRSDIYANVCAELDMAYQSQVESLRSGLLFFLQYGNQVESSGNPYPIDYSLPMEERAAAVREYYTSAFTDPALRLDAYANDTTAKRYLGELYAYLYDYFAAQVK